MDFLWSEYAWQSYQSTTCLIDFLFAGFGALPQAANVRRYPEGSPVPFFHIFTAKAFEHGRSNPSSAFGMIKIEVLFTGNCGYQFLVVISHGSLLLATASCGV
jgi:hypothetical protein